MYWFGFFLGKWLFVLDAFEDIEKDQKNKVYNPVSYTHLPGKLEIP